jgi:hypothetical protein
MDVRVLGPGLLDLTQEPQELLVPLAGFALGDHLPCGHVQGGEQGVGAVANVVMRYSLYICNAEGERLFWNWSALRAMA